MDTGFAIAALMLLFAWQQRAFKTQCDFIGFTAKWLYRTLPTITNCWHKVAVGLNKERFYCGIERNQTLTAAHSGCQQAQLGIK